MMEEMFKKFVGRDDDDEDTVSIVLWSFCEVEEILPWIEYCGTLGGKERGVRNCDCFWRFDGGEGGGWSEDLGDQFVGKVHRIHT
jgi:hypothetical protein